MVPHSDIVLAKQSPGHLRGYLGFVPEKAGNAQLMRIL